MLLALLATVAHAAGYHYVKASASGGVAPADASAVIPEGALGLSLVSDALAGRVTFGDPAHGPLVRAWRVEGEALGPVIGYVPPAFRGVVAPDRVPWALPWTSFRVGGDVDTRRDLELDAAAHTVLNLPGALGVDPRHTYVGPSVGIGINATWWDGWRGGTAPVATGMVTAEAGLTGGVTLRDTWYAQGRAVAHMDLFGRHQVNLGVAAASGISLHRLGVPVGLEVRAELDRGDDNWTLAPRTHWRAWTTVSWMLAPEFQTRIEERIERAQVEQARASELGMVPGG